MKHNKKFNRIELLAITLVPNLMPFKVNAMKKMVKKLIYQANLPPHLPLVKLSYIYKIMTKLYIIVLHF